MKRFFQFLFIFLAGIVIGYVLLNSFVKSDAKKESQVLSYEIKKLSKLIVVEEEWNGIHKEELQPQFGTSFKYDNIINFTHTEIEYNVKVKSQVTYDMKKLQIELDSANKTIHIKYIPEPEINIYPELSVRNLEQGLLNKFTKDELNQVSENAKQSIIKKINTDNLKKTAHETLLENLKDIYHLAKIYNWKIQDDTRYAKELQTFKD